MHNKQDSKSKTMWIKSVDFYKKPLNHILVLGLVYFFFIGGYKIDLNCFEYKINICWLHSENSEKNFEIQLILEQHRFELCESTYVHFCQ